ncbi:helix-turn-helix domain-containing protein [Actinacidiphila sp. bgisy160]|uniref:helix-turn-helix domain-containing protein n=1 Tax=Actinacidiphila sp. bgisy160 TaxID=3413796 RepID=UPI003D70C184
MTHSVTTGDVLALPPTTDLETAAAAAAFGIGRTTAYDLARKGEFPCKVIRAGRRMRVVTADLVRVLGLDAAAPVASQS